MNAPGPWYRTGEVRIVPWYFGLMRAEFVERRDFTDGDGEDAEVVSYQLRTVGTGKLPQEFDGGGAFGFWSTMATPPDARYGQRAIWRNLIKFFNKPVGFKP